MKKLLMGLALGCFLLGALGTSHADEGRFVASKNSDKYHLAGCSVAQKITAANRVSFNSPQDAEKAGYKACKLCNPNGAFFASKGSDKYHTPTCRLVSKISNENLVAFASKQDAEKAGYKPCQICLPSAAKTKISK